MKLNSCVKLLEGTGWGPSSLAKFITTITIVYDTYIFRWGLNSMVYGRYNKLVIWWLIPLSKWDITPVINGISRVNPLIIGVITHLLSGMNHQVCSSSWGLYPCCAPGDPGAPSQEAEVLVLREEAREGREGRPVPLALWRRLVRRWSRYDYL